MAECLPACLPAHPLARRDARAGGADVPEPLIQQISSMEPQQEEQAELFLPVGAAAAAGTRRVPPMRAARLAPCIMLGVACHCCTVLA